MRRGPRVFKSELREDIVHWRRPLDIGVLVVIYEKGDGCCCECFGCAGSFEQSVFCNWFGCLRIRYTIALRFCVRDGEQYRRDVYTNLGKDILSADYGYCEPRDPEMF